MPKPLTNQESARRPFQCFCKTVLWRMENPSHGIFKDEPHGGNLFTDSEFLAFEQILLETMRTQESPQEIKIKDVMSDLSNILNTLSNEVKSNVVSKIDNFLHKHTR